MDHAKIILEGAMKLHNYLVTYRNYHNISTASYTDRLVFEGRCSDNRVISIAVGNDPIRERRNISHTERDERLKILVLRDSLKKI